MSRESHERIDRLRNRVQRLRGVYEDRRKRATLRFPGSVVAGPARYPVARHEKAWASVHKARRDYEKARATLEAAERQVVRVERLSSDTAAQLTRDQAWIDELAVGDRFRFGWSNSRRYFEAIGEVVQVNARTIRQRVVEVVTIDEAVHLRMGHKPTDPSHYADREWSIPKLGRGKNRIIAPIPASTRNP